MTKTIKDTTKNQKRISHRLIADTLGAKEIGIKIDPKRNPISLFTLRKFILKRLISTGGRPKLRGATKERNKIPLIEGDWQKLESIAENYKKKDGINVSPGQIGSSLIHSILSQIRINS